MQNQETSWLMFRVMMTAILALASYYIGRRVVSIGGTPAFRLSVWATLLGFPCCNSWPR